LKLIVSLFRLALTVVLSEENNTLCQFLHCSKKTKATDLLVKEKHSAS